MTVQKLLAQDDHWLCPRCDHRQIGKNVVCVQCLVFKPMTFYKSLIHDAQNAPASELQSLMRRRTIESQLLIHADKESTQNKVWYLVSNKWLYEWKCFIQNRISLNQLFDNKSWTKRVRKSENLDIGVLPPGPITNQQDLFTQIALEDGTCRLQLKQGLRVNIHYRAVNANVWLVLQRNYGGGPAIAREALDIYSKDVSSKVIISQATLQSISRFAYTLQMPAKRKSKEGEF
jgi:DUSP domain